VSFKLYIEVMKYFEYGVEVKNLSILIYLHDLSIYWSAVMAMTRLYIELWDQDHYTGLRTKNVTSAINLICHSHELSKLYWLNPLVVELDPKMLSPKPATAQDPEPVKFIFSNYFSRSIYFNTIFMSSLKSNWLLSKIIFLNEILYVSFLSPI
jgi:hypothetical protein